MEDILEQKNRDSALTGQVAEFRQGEVEPESELRIWGFFRKDLELTPGKMAAQAGHAFGTCIIMTERTSPETMDEYLSHAQPKIAVAVSGEAELKKMVELCRDAGLVTAIVQDAGRTELQGQVFTAGAVGPCLKSDLPKKVKRLQLLKNVFNSDG